MLVSDLRHFLELDDDAPAPARNLAERLGFVVRAATAGTTAIPWVSALRCRRRPGHRRCPGYVTVLRADDQAPIEWSCSACGDQGTISDWQDSPCDLRPAGVVLSGNVIVVSISDEIAATLRGITVLGLDCERLVFRTQAVEEGLVLAGMEEELGELVGFVAAEANHETNHRRRRRLDAAFSVLSDAIPGSGF